ncbi:hypothetical protein IW150_004635 [Coemansia sp. RSA 2607]|nr:hypothetical protein IW150_004635 [Coemansia sp. RSA 2607]
MVDIKYEKSDDDAVNAMEASDVEVETGNDASDAEDDEVYVVESIKAHVEGEDGEKRYQIKWAGYPDSECTWEKEENIIDKELLKKYWEGVRAKKQARSKQSSANGKANQPPPASKRRRTTDMVTSDNEDEAEAEDRKAYSKYTKHESWENLVKEIMTIDKADDGSLVVFIKWNDDTTSEHPVESAYAKCPQLMLKFYEGRLRFREK